MHTWKGTPPKLGRRKRPNLVRQPRGLNGISLGLRIKKYVAVRSSWPTMSSLEGWRHRFLSFPCLEPGRSGTMSGRATSSLNYTAYNGAETPALGCTSQKRLDNAPNE